MARYSGPVCRLCRREGGKLFLKGDRCFKEKCAFERRGYAPGEHGWLGLTLGSYLLRYFVAIGLLAPVTLLMGGTLTLLIRFLVGTEVSRAGWRAGLLYGTNTAGAACACLLVDVLWIPRLGIGWRALTLVGIVTRWRTKTDAAAFSPPGWRNCQTHRT